MHPGVLTGNDSFTVVPCLHLRREQYHWLFWYTTMGAFLLAIELYVGVVLPMNS
jgi:hypothetical protein